MFAKARSMLCCTTSFWQLSIFVQHVLLTTFCYHQYGFFVSAMDASNVADIIGRLTKYDIIKNGIEQNLTSSDRSTLLVRLESKPDLMSLRYANLRNGVHNRVCILNRNVTKSYRVETRCRTVNGQSCNRELVLTNQIMIVRDCEADRLTEVCETKMRTQKVESQTVICQLSEKLICKEKDLHNHNETMTCQPNRLAVCEAKPQVITLTVQQQLCGEDFLPKSYRTTQLCITYGHNHGSRTVGEWKCLDLRKLYSGRRCLEFNARKQIYSEITRD